MLGRFLRACPVFLWAAGFVLPCAGGIARRADHGGRAATSIALPPLFHRRRPTPSPGLGPRYRRPQSEARGHAGSFAQTTLAPDRSEIYAVVTYFSKLNRGERHEEINVFDAATLKLKAEIPIPPVMLRLYRAWRRCALRGWSLHSDTERHASHLDQHRGSSTGKNGCPGSDTGVLLRRLPSEIGEPLRHAVRRWHHAYGDL